MTNNVIHQIYCTHCTYGSSALEQREGELAERVLGYSARAGSLAHNELRGVYRQVERFLYYYLPSDSPPEERLKLDAATAPCRMFYSPSIGRLQMLGQIVYRRHDTAGRAGSYFAHVLFAEREAEPWPVLECLRLWDAPWVVEDTPEHAKHLPTLAALDELRQGRPAAIDDGVLLSFLTTPPAGQFNDPRRVVPERWRSAPAAERVELLVDVAGAYIELGSNRRESVLLVCEPSLAALVFYGVARLLPPGAVRAGVSFSTYEPSPDRLPVALAATTFHTPEATDLKPDAYRRRGYVNNTFLRTRSGAGRPGGSYPRLMVETLLADGWQAVDVLLGDFAAAGCGQVEELEALAQTHRLAGRMLDPAATLDPAVWAKSAVAERYLRAGVERQLSAAETNGLELRALVGSPRQMLLLELAAAREGSESSPNVQFLLRNVPAERLSELLSSQRVSWEAKVATLTRHLASTGGFPEGCDLIWADYAGAVKRASLGTPPLLSAAIARLPQPALVSLREAVPEGRDDAFILALARACPIESHKQAALERLLAEIVAALDEQRLIALLGRCRTELQATYAKPEPLLAQRLSKLLYELPDRPREFARRLEVLSGWVDYFKEPGLAEQRLSHWRKLHSILESLGDGESKKSAGIFRSKFKPDYKGLADALRKAMPDAVYTDDLTGTLKKKRLRELGTAMLGSPDFLAPAVWNKITRYIEYGDWSDAARSRSKSARPGRSPTGKPLPKRGGKPKRGPPGGGWFGRWIVLLAVGLGSALGMVIYGAWQHATNPPTVAEQTGDGQESTGKQAASSKPKETEPARQSKPPTSRNTNPPRDAGASPRTPPKSANARTQGTVESTPLDVPSDAVSDDRQQPPRRESVGVRGKSPADDDPLPEDQQMPSATQEPPEPTDPTNPHAAPDSPAATASNDRGLPGNLTPDSTAPLETPKADALPRAENVHFPSANSFDSKTITNSIPDNEQLQLKLFGSSLGSGYDKLQIVAETGYPKRMILFRGPQRKAVSGANKSPYENALGAFQVLSGQLSFQWIGSGALDDDRFRKRFCLNGFVLRVAGDHVPPSYFALYQPKSVAAVEVDPETLIATIRPGDLKPKDPKEKEGNVGNRPLRLGPGKVYFEHGEVREFDEAPDDNEGKTASLKSSTAEGNDAPFDVELKRTQNVWTLKLIAKLPPNAITEAETSGGEPFSEGDAQSAALVPRHISATLYRLIDTGRVNVRVDEVIIGKPEPQPSKKSAEAAAQ